MAWRHCGNRRENRDPKPKGGHLNLDPTEPALRRWSPTLMPQHLRVRPLRSLTRLQAGAEGRCRTGLLLAVDRAGP